MTNKQRKYIALVVFFYCNPAQLTLNIWISMGLTKEHFNSFIGNLIMSGKVVYVFEEGINVEASIKMCQCHMIQYSSKQLAQVISNDYDELSK